MINKFFWKTVNILIYIANKSGLTYNEVNVILYYLIIPLSWAILIDIKLTIPLFTFIVISYWIILVHKKNFKTLCDNIFVKSQIFLSLFGEYKKSSVIICILFPIIIYTLLIIMLLF